MHIVCLMGPPGAGKTSLTAWLSAHGTVFRLRKEVAAQHLLTSDGAVSDWLSLPLVQIVFSGFVQKKAQKDTKLLICDNFPGNAEQIDLVHDIARANGVGGLRLVYLVLPVAVILTRLQTRLVCNTCEHDPLGDPRSPAEVSAETPNTCARCGSPLARRPNDAGSRLQNRLDRSQKNMAGILQKCERIGLTLHQLDATQPTADLGQIILTMLPRDHRGTA